MKMEKYQYIKLDNLKFTKCKNGYYRKTTGDRILLHRYIWEKFNGKIPKEYDIHHLDGDRDNNDIENLGLITRNEYAMRYNIINNQYTKGMSKRVTVSELPFRQCKQCGVNIPKKYSPNGYIKRKYCGRECHYEWARGRTKAEAYPK